MYKNLIALIPVDDEYTEIEFTSYKHILDVLKTSRIKATIKRRVVTDCQLMLYGRSSIKSKTTLM